MFSAPASKDGKRSRYRSKRAVRPQKEVPTHLVTSWTKTKLAIVCCGAGILAMTTLFPIMMLEVSMGNPAAKNENGNRNNYQASVSLHGLFQKSREVKEEFSAKGLSFEDGAANNVRGALQVQEPDPLPHHLRQPNSPVENQMLESQQQTEKEQTADYLGNEDEKAGAQPKEMPVEIVEARKKKKTPKAQEIEAKRSKKNPKSSRNAPKEEKESKRDPESQDKEAPAETHKDEQQTAKDNKTTVQKPPLARGVAGLPTAQTPALIGAQPGHIECDVNVDDIAYWNEPQGERDQNFISPFATPPEHYLTFEPDMGGWNNIRMSMEIIFVFAAATGRTLVLPPKSPFYLLGTGKQNVRSFGDFYNLDKPAFQKHVKVITMEEFLEKEKNNLLKLSAEEYEKLKPVADACLHQDGSPIHCDVLFEKLRQKGMQPEIEGFKNCFIFDLDRFNGKEISEDVKKRVERFCDGGRRKAVYYDDELHLPQLIHWNAGSHKFRLLNHFYAFFYFTDPKIDNFYKRFVRDFMHYKDKIYCAAGKIVHALNAEGQPWSALHVRRGDLQYKQVKISAEEWLNNTKEVWEPKELLFIATDERNKTFFDPIKEHHDIRFLDDYWDMADLGDLESNFLGMVDTIVASHGRAFAGTWFSTFTGYINRMRGYLGHSMTKSWYSWLPRKDVMQEWLYPTGNTPAREWPIGWSGIDGDEWIEHETVPLNAQAVSERQSPVKDIKLSDLEPDIGFQAKPVSRGVAGRSLSETPALEGARRAHVECDVNVDSLAYWNSPQGKRDEEFRSPFAVEGEEKYISFSSDRGGWNNVRMSMEIIFVIAAATGRTLVLPPREPLYRLKADHEHLHRGFADFFPLETSEFAKRVKTITMKEFIEKEGGPNGRLPIPKEMVDHVKASADHCDKIRRSNSWCGYIHKYLQTVGYSPETRAQDGCFVFDADIYAGRNASVENQQVISHWCGKRKQFHFTGKLQEETLIHFRAGEKELRLLTHFYSFVHFTDPQVGNFYKRFVRDFLRYQDPIYCAAGKIVKALQLEGKRRGFERDDEGAGGFSAMHVRRGELQYKKVKIPAAEWYNNTKELWKPGEIIYVATDERNKTWFDPIAEHHDLRFLDDYFDLAQLKDLDPNWFGMIDTIVASRGRVFAGTFFSTFTGYINRLRGYHGLSMKDSWYSWLPRKEKMQTWEHQDDFAYAFEWPDGWVGIDADVRPSKDKF